MQVKKIKYLELPLFSKESQKRDYAVLKRGNGDYMGNVKKLRNWLQNKASYIDTLVAGV